MAELAEDRDLIVGDNQPYSGRNAHGYTMHRHADRRGLANALIEVRNDLISTEQDAFSWADRLAPVLERVLQSDNLAKTMA